MVSNQKHNSVLGAVCDRLSKRIVELEEQRVASLGTLFTENVALNQQINLQREKMDDLDDALGDLNEIAHSLGIELPAIGLRQKIHGLGLAVTGLIRDHEQRAEKAERQSSLERDDRLKVYARLEHALENKEGRRK